MLWATVIKGINGEDRKLGNKSKSFYPSIWLDIVHDVDQFKSQVYALESCKNVIISTKLSHDNVGSSLRHSPRGGAEHVQLELLANVKGISLAYMSERWV
nr:hypothetical protein [Tanacetum cinerariifolium]